MSAHRCEPVRRELVRSTVSTILWPRPLWSAGCSCGFVGVIHENRERALEEARSHEREEQS